ncbi:MAG: cell division protein ZapD [Gammaproteobacteria bacterium]
MSSRPADIPDVDQAASTVTYEQPLSERMRTYLRMEFLAQQTNHHSLDPAPWSSRAAVASLLEILTILGRGDLRTEVMKELEKQASLLEMFASKPGVDSKRLATLLERVTVLRARLTESGSQYAQPLKESEFLSAIKHRSAIPGGTCEFDLPDFKHWLNLPYDERVSDFQIWFSAIKPLCDAVGQLLWLIREGSPGQPQQAHHGLFQHSIERGTPSQLLRVSLPTPASVYPEISGSQHRFTIRFYSWSGIEQRPVQCMDDVEFLLACC